MFDIEFMWQNDSDFKSFFQASETILFLSPQASSTSESWSSTPSKQHKEMTFSYKYFFLWESSQGGLAPENSSANTFVERNDQHNKTSSLPITKSKNGVGVSKEDNGQGNGKNEETIATIHEFIYIIHSFVFVDAKTTF